VKAGSRSNDHGAKRMDRVVRNSAARERLRATRR
jgi:hypothetical protein